MQKQIEKLLAEIKAESESESAHEIDLKTELIEKNMQVKMLEGKVKSQGASWKLQLEET